MVKTVNFRAEIPADRELRISLPNDVPVGSAEIVLTISSPAPPVAKLGDLLNSELFGAWRERTDIRDSGEFARDVRSKAWDRTHL